MATGSRRSRPPLHRRKWSIASQIVVLGVVFLAVPALVYEQLRSLDRERVELIKLSTREQGRLIARALSPMTFGGERNLPELSAMVGAIAGDDFNVKVLYRPDAPAPVAQSAGATGDAPSPPIPEEIAPAEPYTPPRSFYYVAASPTVDAKFLGSELRRLRDAGLLDTIGPTCGGVPPLAMRHEGPGGRESLITAVTPISSSTGCWVVIASYSGGAFLESSLARPFWDVPELRIATLTYLGMAALALAIGIRIRRRVRRFGVLAKEMAESGAARSFAAANDVAELDGLAREMDRMVDRLGALTQAVARSPSPIVIARPDRSIDYVNGAFSELTGYSADEARTRGLALLFDGDADTQLADIWETIGTGRIWHGEVRSRSKSGRAYWALVSVFWLSGSGGADSRVIVTQQDMTEQKRNALELATAKEQAEFANRSKSAFLANVSHELRTPLNAILGFSEVIANELFGRVNERRYVDYARDINDSGHHLLSVINDILDLSKLEAGRVELNEAEVEPAAILDAVERLFEEQARSRGIILDVATATGLPAIMADERTMRQVLFNLASNAVKFSEEGGTVSIKAFVDTNGFAFQVADDGPGIAAEHLARIMEPYEQAKPHETRGREGTGLGLAIVKRIVDLHGGRVDIDSAPGHGTTATVVLPCCRIVAKAVAA